MRPRFGAVLTLLAALTVAGFARAEDAQTCEVPAYLLTTDSTLSKVADAIKNARPLNVLVVGSRSSTILSSEASAYPARLQAALKERLPSIPVTLSVELQSGKTAEDVAAGLVKLVEAKKPYFGHLADRHRGCYAIGGSRRFPRRCRRRSCCVAKRGSRCGYGQLAVQPAHRNDDFCAAVPR